MIERMNVRAVLMFIVFVFPGCSPSLEERVKTYEESHNRHDIEKVMSMYTDDITFEIIGSWKKTGKEQVRGIAEWDAATNSHMIVSNIEVIDDTVTFRLKEGNDWFRLIGIRYMYYEPCRMVFKDGSIKELTAEGTQESIMEFQKTWPSVYQWLSEERNEELSKLISGGEFIYNTENANKWLSLLEEWQNR